MEAVLLYLAVGVAAGTVSGLLGVGGGIVITPVLHYAMRMPWADAVALSLLVIAIQSPVGTWRHAQKGAVSWRIAVPMTLGGAVGVGLGHLLLPVLPVAWLKLFFAALLAFGAWRMRHLVVTPRTQAHPWPVLAAVGLGAGLISRLLGVGGGIVTVPVLGLMGVPLHVAVGTSLVPVFTNAAVASGANLAQGLDWVAGIPLAAGAMAGAVLGVRIAHALPERGLRRVVAAGMVAGALAVAASVVSAASARS